MTLRSLACCLAEPVEPQRTFSIDRLAPASLNRARTAVELVQPKFAPPMDPFGAWLHPLEVLVKTAREEPDTLALLTNENSITERYSYLQVWQKAYSIAQGLKALPGWGDEGHEVVGTFCETEAHWALYMFALWILGKKVFNFGLNTPASVRRDISQRLGIRYILYHYTRPGHTEGVKAIDAGVYPLLGEVPDPSLELCEPLNEFVAYLCTLDISDTPKMFKYSHLHSHLIRTKLGLKYVKMGMTMPPSFPSATALMFMVAFGTKGSLWFPKPASSPMQRAMNTIRLLEEGLEFYFATSSSAMTVFKKTLSINPATKWGTARRIVIGLEIVPPSLVYQARQLCPNAEIRCIYASIETLLIDAVAYFALIPSNTTPGKLVYTLNRPNIRCLLCDEEGNVLEPSKTRVGILMLAVDKDHPIKNHPDFINADPDNKLASFGFLPDGSPRVCTMDWVELVGEREFTVVGRFDQRVRINDAYVDFNALEELVNQHLGDFVADCAFVQTSEKIVMLYIPRAGTDLYAIPAEIQQMAENLITLKNAVKLSIHDCLELDCIPINDSGKRDLKKLRRIAERADRL
ncbi:uncharacterized protein BJ171DRAFT_599386 [Polychytrium aggregatum]|uniref:uncharacterized protein n=1 Tax=Polychytrium aggregatum TaxID=110093 RepID=UPI0022FE1FED|nr:uncharacterized protein BJ171DRAFT_599386 [Polychytrium aggregatum]KAI9204214.1 hypothetical protein BJ171DRAFT_599386 [Polychytrium aggregatum]